MPYARWFLIAVALYLAAARGVSAQVLDLDGRAVEVFAPRPGAATVLLFTATDCPISNRYAPEVKRLHDAFAPRGVRLLLVYANPADTPQAIREHVRRFGYTAEAVRDPRHELVRRAEATVTPEAAVFDAGGRLAYHGRIDDRFVDFGVDRSQPTRRDLRDALTAVLEGRAPAEPVTRAVGCFIPDAAPPSPRAAHAREGFRPAVGLAPRPLRWLLARTEGGGSRFAAYGSRRSRTGLESGPEVLASRQRRSPADSQPQPQPQQRTPARAPADVNAPLTFTRDIAPLMFERCGACHRPSGPAPFSLLTYAQVKARAAQIAAVTGSGFMPPWKADADGGPFVGQKPLTSAERGVIKRWVEMGAPEGDARDLPPRPAWTDGWQLGTPDLVVTVPEVYRLQAEASDVFRIFALPLPVDRARYVRGIEFRPGNGRVVHHANIRIDRTRASRDLDAADPLPGYDGLMPRSAEYPDGHFLGWTPGQIAPLVSADLAWRLEPGTDLVLQLHMQPSGAVESVQPSIGIYFSDTPPTRTPAILRLGSQGIDIPPGEARHVIRDSYVLPVDVTVLALQPHAHYRARDILGTATLPDGTTRRLIHIAEWDFRWQHVYRYEQPLALPRGTTLSMQYTFDNSAANVRNPQQPPARVLWGQRSRDEMGDLWFQLLPANDRDREVLNQQVRAKMLAEDIVGLETMLIANPDDSELHDDAGVLYLGQNRAAEAVRHFAATAALKPDAAPSHFNLGTALTVARRLPEAIAEYRRALAIRPDYVSAHNNLASVLAAIGERDEAIMHFRAALRLEPDSVQAASNLAWNLAVSGAATAADGAEAVSLAERAVRLTARRDQYALDVLAAAYANTSRFDEAAAIAREALALDPASTLAAGIRERAALYAKQKAYVRGR